jgi:hypothetical protein
LSNFGQDLPVEPQSPICQKDINSEKIVSSTKKRTLSEMMADNLPKPLNLNPLGTPKKPYCKGLKMRETTPKRCSRWNSNLSNHRRMLNACKTCSRDTEINNSVTLNENH